MHDNHKKNIRVTFLSIVSNVLLTLGKIVVGGITGSTAVIAEAIHSGVDLIAAIIAHIAVRKAAKPADKRHPYGHGKFDSLSGMIEGLLIFAAAAYIIYEGISKLIHRSEIESIGLGFAIMLVSAVVNSIVSYILFRTAKKTGSIAVEADAHHLSTDVITSVGVAAAMLIIYFTGWHILDPIIALIVAVLILKAAFDITKKAVGGLLDESLPEEEITAMRDIINKRHPVFIDFYELRTRRSGSTRFIDFSLITCAEMTVEQSHNVADEIEKDIYNLFPDAQIMIHIEPCDRSKPDCQTTCPIPTVIDIYSTTKFGNNKDEEKAKPEQSKFDVSDKR